MSTPEAVQAIRAVRAAAHQLANACASMVGGTEMALSTPTIEELAESLKGIVPRPLPGAKREKRQLD